jgi:hypothetical protein
MSRALRVCLSRRLGQKKSETQGHINLRPACPVREAPAKLHKERIAGVTGTCKTGYTFETVMATPLGAPDLVTLSKSSDRACDDDAGQQ